jgi:hypothetical protein
MRALSWWCTYATDITKEIAMSTKHPRIHVLVEEPIYRTIHALATNKGVSISALTHSLIREALELREDAGLTMLAEAREESLEQAQLLSHNDVWGE